MPSFSNKSLDILKTCDERLQDIMLEAIKVIDFSILEGHRNQEKQELMFNKGKSKLKFPHSKHNSFPSKAIDIAPYPINWTDKARFYMLAGVIFGIAHSKGIKLRWGGDWDCDFDFTDQSFNDLPHFEIKE